MRPLFCCCCFCRHLAVRAIRPHPLPLAGAVFIVGSDGSERSCVNRGGGRTWRSRVRSRAGAGRSRPRSRSRSCSCISRLRLHVGRPVRHLRHCAARSVEKKHDHNKWPLGSARFKPRPPSAIVSLRTRLRCNCLCRLSVPSVRIAVQVSTRFLSTCPSLYWFAAQCVHTAQQQQEQEERNVPATVQGKSRSGTVVVQVAGQASSSPSRVIAWLGRWLPWWALLYAVLGCALFSTFLPWT